MCNNHTLYSLNVHVVNNFNGIYGAAMPHKQMKCVVLVQCVTLVLISQFRLTDFGAGMLMRVCLRVRACFF